MGKKGIQISTLVLFMVFTISFLTLSGCGDNNSSSDNNTTIGTHTLVGSWLGTWDDTIYQVSGSLSFDITQNNSTLDATGTIGLNSLGLGDETGTATGTINGNNNVTFTFNSSTVGSGSGTINGNNGSGNGVMTGTLGFFGPFTFTGTISGNTITGTFDFTDPAGGAGTATLQKQ